jgi:hypothetical protein
MSLPQPVTHFGVHSVTPYSLTDGTPYGILKVVHSASLALAGKLVPLMGGSNKYAWDVQETTITTEMSLKLGEYPDFVYTLFAGVTPTNNAADTLGAISTAVNKKGTSVIAATGILAPQIISGSETDLKFGKYVLVAKSATTLQVYYFSDVDIARGTGKTYVDGTLATQSVVVTIATTVVSNLSGWGIKLTGGASTTAFVTGDTATFEVRPENTGSTIAVFGAVGATFPEFGALVYAKKKGTGEMVEIDCYRCKGEGVPLKFDENKYSEADVKITLMYDSTQDGVFRLRRVTPITAV